MPIKYIQCKLSSKRLMILHTENAKSSFVQYVYPEKMKVWTLDCSILA